MKKALLLLVFSMSCLLLSAQPDTDPPGDPFNGDPDNAVPITGLEWLLVGGSLLGLKKITDTRKMRKGEE